MKKVYLFLFSIVILIVIMVSIIVRKNTTENNELITLPSLSLLNINGEFTNSNFLANDKYKILVFFSTDCFACSEELKSFTENSNNLEGIQIIFLSSNSLDSIQNFIWAYGNYSENVFHDIDKGFSKIMNINAFPSILIFNKNNVLMKKIVGAAPLEDIIKYIPLEK